MNGEANYLHIVYRKSEENPTDPDSELLSAVYSGLREIESLISDSLAASDNLPDYLALV